MSAVSPNVSDDRGWLETDVVWVTGVDVALRGLVLLQHFVTSVYFAALALLHYIAAPTETVLLGGAYMKLSAYVFGLVALLHASSLACSCVIPVSLRCYAPTTRVVTLAPNNKKRPPIVLSANARIALAHLVEVACETYVASTMAHSICACVYFRFRCASQGIPASSHVDDYIRAETLGDNLAFLHIQDCDVPRGLENKTLAQFPSLFGLRLERTQLQTWDVPSAVFPSLKRIDILYSALTTVPKFLSESGPDLRWVYIIGSNISSLPDEVAVTWQSLFTLWLHECNLTQVPAPVTRLENLQSLGLTSNAISTIPAMASVTNRQLSWVYLEFNQLSEVPWQLLKDNPAIELYLSGNPIASLTNVSNIVDVSGSPYCTSESTPRICSTLCAPRCSAMLQNNFLCQRECNTSACGFNAGSCLSKF
ncbi:hypothetical protein SDRG_14631 [Saprolegnia diclina VS20]|uniref:LNR domain-containing protein n=1 Tax=Saprolegnia diclina (strain VS20) TaxID=1156394 RepID=T0RDC2_SAPDV|nr:hypothetical protein SDRG_14631 [Saprolegnia diclina VS20]EQC27577.1 hypothetical protein SDRG_14631 [Saprolegnia diclina VS20]|eukprot:XP_008618997.1 hypothetical protein SDRG_14631 [Saprolegnia diclina VS20]